MVKQIDFMENADNVYRADCFIVKQTIRLSVNPTGDNAIVSMDV